MPGARVLASTASARRPRVCTASSARFRLAETQKYGSHRSSMRDSPKNPRTSRLYLPPRLNARKGRVMSSNESARPAARVADDAVVVPARHPLRAHHGAHAGAADGIHGDAELLQGAQHAEVGEAAREPAAEHEAHGAPRGEARQPRHVLGVVRGARAGGGRRSGPSASVRCRSGPPCPGDAAGPGSGADDRRAPGRAGASRSRRAPGRRSRRPSAGCGRPGAGSARSRGRRRDRPRTRRTGSRARAGRATARGGRHRDRAPARRRVVPSAASTLALVRCRAGPRVLERRHQPGRRPRPAPRRGDAGTTAIVITGASTRRPRDMSCTRATTRPDSSRSIACGCRSTSRSSDSRSRRASCVSRTATTVADRGAPPRYAISPITSPAPSSATMRDVSSACVTMTATRPLTSR